MGLCACAPEFESDVLARQEDALRWVASIGWPRQLPHRPDDPVVGVDLGRMWKAVDFMLAEATGCAPGDTGLGWPADAKPSDRGLVPTSAVQARVALAGVGILKAQDPVEVCEYLWEVGDFDAAPDHAEALTELLDDLEAFLRTVSERELRVFCALGEPEPEAETDPAPSTQ